ncbi:hypothetical protein Scel_84980 [Streptomyces cellostaticus]|nr:hypothetical protein Scel_84980 [Streptomyces cellostaticus]
MLPMGCPPFRTRPPRHVGRRAVHAVAGAPGVGGGTYGLRMTDQWWADLRQRVEAAGAGPEGSRVFGALGHEWVVEDPLTQGELAELEAQTGVRLPEEYRTFLLRIGAGGAGPAYGLFPVRRVQGRWRWEGDGADLADLSRLAAV